MFNGRSRRVALTHLTRRVCPSTSFGEFYGIAGRHISISGDVPGVILWNQNPVIAAVEVRSSVGTVTWLLSARLTRRRAAEVGMAT